MNNEGPRFQQSYKQILLSHLREIRKSLLRDFDYFHSKRSIWNEMLQVWELDCRSVNLAPKGLSVTWKILCAEDYVMHGKSKTTRRVLHCKIVLQFVAHRNITTSSKCKRTNLCGSHVSHWNVESLSLASPTGLAHSVILLNLYTSRSMFLSLSDFSRGNYSSSQAAFINNIFSVSIAILLLMS